MRFSLSTLLVLAYATVMAQSNTADLTAAVGSSSGAVSMLFERDWNLDKKNKFMVGGGVRFTSFFASNKNLITAPAELTSGSTGPFVIFKENIDENIDTVFLNSINVNALNLFINLGYQLSGKVQVGFNIDAIGFSFGKKQSGTFITNNTETSTNADATSFNALLISDNDRGSLNSEFYVRYGLNETWSLKGGVQFVFTEYTTETEVQQFPEPNDRFRLKSLLVAVGVSKRF